MQSIAALAGTGEAVSAAYVKHRKAIEASHGNDDGTEIHYERQHGDRREYANDLPDPISEASPLHTLAYYGLGRHDLELLERHKCLSIGDVRLALSNGYVLSWTGVDRITRDRIADAVEMVGR